MIQQDNKIKWKEVELGNEEYFKILSSGINKFNGEKEYLSTESIKGTAIKKVECKITYEDRPSRANMQPVLNSVWFAKMKATLKVYMFTKENEQEVKKYILSTGFVGIKLNENISPNYLKLYFISKRFNDEKDKLCTGSTQVGINNSFIVKIKIPIPFSNGKPDLKEQERIVSILEKAEKVKVKGDNAGKLLDEYLKSVFNEMFLIGKDFPKKSLAEIVERLDAGKSLAGNQENKNKVLKTSSVSYDYFISEELKDLPLNYTPKETHLVKKGDVLISRMNTLELVGAAAYVFSVPSNVYIPDRLWKAILNRSIEPIYLWKCITTKSFKKQIADIAGGTSGSMKNISQAKYLDLKIPLPPIQLQQKFAKIVEHIEGLKENVKKTKQNSEELFNSLMSKAFRGKL